jgi:nucleotide-binding universal stress UspA family protein
MPLEILAVLTDPDSVALCLTGAAAAAAIDEDARIEGFHARPTPESLIMPTEEVLTATRRAELERHAAERAKAVEGAFSNWQAAAGRVGGIAAWRDFATGSVEKAVAERGRSADLVVLVRPHGAEGQAALHAAIFETGRPLLLLPPIAVPPFGRHLAIAWKPSQQAERALTAALPWLKRAKHVSVLTVGLEDGPQALALPLLAGNGIAAKPVVIEAGGEAVPERLLREAHEIGADGLVMGAYRHHRIMEMILGGVTRHMLAHADLPVLLMH